MNDVLIQLIIRKHIKVVSIDGLLALLAAFRKQTCYFHYFMYLSIFLFVENKFFFFFFFIYFSSYSRYVVRVMKSAATIILCFFPPKNMFDIRFLTEKTAT